jgi:tannase/feruloyl esterase
MSSSGLLASTEYELELAFRARVLPAAALGILVLADPSRSVAAVTAATPSTSDLTQRCLRLPQSMAGKFAESSTRLTSATVVDSTTVQADGGGGPPRSLQVPKHCEIRGISQERVGANGQHYAIRFHLRLPLDWNGRLLFQGGGGSNGVQGDALGAYSPAAPAALQQGFAVVSQDSGHDNTLNNDPTRGGVLTFGFDAQARANYGHASLPVVATAAKAVITSMYSQPLRYSYFVGCSKGGEEGLAFAERYPVFFDGIAAGAPAMSLPRAAVEEAWDTQALASAVQLPAGGSLSIPELAGSFSDADLMLIRNAVLGACDADDGLEDGIVGDFTKCTTERVLPLLRKQQCAAGQSNGCLRERQIEALSRVMSGAHDRSGHALYSDWPWDTGLAAPGWRVWKSGLSPGPPSLNVILGGPSLASVFTTPPTALSADPAQALAFVLKFDFDRDAPRIYATDPQFPHSGWDDVSARSADLSGFRARHGKLMLTHGVSDPVFSINDTVQWWREVDTRNDGQAASFVRLFPVPGMNHCAGGAATDLFDILAPLMKWVESGIAPQQILAHAGPNSPWPRRERPLCAYPAVARYKGHGDIDEAGSFACRN